MLSMDKAKFPSTKK